MMERGRNPSLPSPNIHTSVPPPDLRLCSLKTNEHPPAQPLTALTSVNFRHLCPPTPTPVSEQKEKEPGKGGEQEKTNNSHSHHDFLQQSLPHPPKQRSSFSLAATTSSSSPSHCHLLKILCIAELLDGDSQEVASDICDYHIGAGGHLRAPVASLLLRVRRGEG